MQVSHPALQNLHNLVQWHHELPKPHAILIVKVQVQGSLMGPDFPNGPQSGLLPAWHKYPVLSDSALQIQLSMVKASQF